ncbi:MAG: GTPase Era [Eubacteriales bacterium]|nr:GTPase Era [Eubacteriales bacterium]
MSDFKSGFVSIIGKPNVGKSTLLNAFLGQKITIVSERPQTTRNTINGVYTDQNCQIVFLDTPGVHVPHNKLSEFMMRSVDSALEAVDLALVLTQADRGLGEGDRELMARMSEKNIPFFAVVNKQDLAPETAESMKKLIEEINPACGGVFVISAQNGRGVERLFSAVKDKMPPGPMYFPEDEITDRPERFLASELIREAALRFLREEIPHGIGIGIERMHERENGLIDIQATIYCEKKSHKSIIIGKNGAMLKAIGTEARRQIEELLAARVNLQMWVKISEDWRNNDAVMNELGYVSD